MIIKCLTCGKYRIGFEAEWQEYESLPVDLQELIKEMDSRLLLSHGYCDDCRKMLVQVNFVTNGKPNWFVGKLDVAIDLGLMAGGNS